MLSESFVLLPSIRAKKEKAIWRQGIKSWSDFNSAKTIKGISAHRKERYDSLLQIANKHLINKNSSFFQQLMHFSDQWRLYEVFRDDAVYLDIETNGYYSGITVVGLSDGIETKTFVRGFNLDRNLIMKELSKYQMIVTFNGASFDLPVLLRYFGLKVNLPHVDLRFVCQKTGYTGGLKAIEKQVGIKRRPEVESVTGEDAVYLWEMWKSTGNREYLEKLVMYNEEDILNLRPLASKVVPQLWVQTRQSCL